ncbi:hypothetical protein [Myroides sp. DF42-4-2]|uniref:hypothetical protein n=1 Tax=unclassified Myroides TaxID=2642485 RepID=UPI002575B415|nr:hypothetical protein [Myroides sp. DF42-4-2]MDM1407907.1 hypothetical protein [Myroides sp. DF42-4-2]
MEKAILELMQLIEKGDYVVAEVFAVEIKKQLQRMMDVETADEALVRLAKMQKIVEDLQEKIKP